MSSVVVPFVNSTWLLICSQGYLAPLYWVPALLSALGASLERKSCNSNNHTKSQNFPTVENVVKRRVRVSEKLLLGKDDLWTAEGSKEAAEQRGRTVLAEMGRGVGLQPGWNKHRNGRSEPEPSFSPS